MDCQLSNSFRTRFGRPVWLRAASPAHHSSAVIGWTRINNEFDWLPIDDGCDCQVAPGHRSILRHQSVSSVTSLPLSGTDVDMTRSRGGSKQLPVCIRMRQVLDDTRSASALSMPLEANRRMESYFSRNGKEVFSSEQESQQRLDFYPGSLGFGAPAVTQEVTGSFRLTWSPKKPF